MSLKEKYFKSYRECVQPIEDIVERELETVVFEEIINGLIKDAETLKIHLERIDSTDPDYGFCRAHLPFLYFQIGIHYLIIDRLSEAECYFKKVIDFIEDPLLPENIWLSIDARNYIGRLEYYRGNIEKTLKLCHEAEKLYLDFREKPDCVAVHVFEGMDNPPASGEMELELVHTLTKLSEAATYQIIGEPLNSLKYYYEALRGQLVSGSEIFEPIDWAMDSMFSCKFFVENNLFKQARHYLAAASHILNEYANNLEKKVYPRRIESEKEKLRYKFADLSCCWAEYGIFILSYSKNKMWNRNVDEDEGLREIFGECWFDSLDVTHYEDQVTDEAVVTLEDARKVFLFSQRHLNKAKEVYTLSETVSRYVSLVQDQSSLLCLLSVFESDPKRKFKMLKKRAEMLEAVVRELNPKDYLKLCRQLWLELGEVYHNMMVLKSKRVEEEPNFKFFSEVASLTALSAKNFNRFLDSAKDIVSGELPDPLDKDLIQGVLTAHFFLGHLHLKSVMPSKRFQRTNKKRAYKYLKYFVDFCDKSKEAKAIAEEGYDICKEMITLLQTLEV